MDLGGLRVEISMLKRTETSAEQLLCGAPDARLRPFLAHRRTLHIERYTLWVVDATLGFRLCGCEHGQVGVLSFNMVDFSYRTRYSQQARAPSPLLLQRDFVIRVNLAPVF